MPGTDRRYIHDYDSAHNRQILQGRRADTHAAFFLPYLSSGMSLLDVGCGPGTITMDLAELVDPAEVVGLDLERTQIELASATALNAGIENVHFLVGNVHDLPFADSSFDAVFSHAVVEHLSDPVGALNEVHRVLKPGGIAGVRAPCWRGLLFAPLTPEWEEIWSVYFRVRQHLGGDPFVGTKLRQYMREAGFQQSKVTASFETWGTLEETRQLEGVIHSLFEETSAVEAIKENGWFDDDGLSRIEDLATEWGADPDAMFAHPWVEAVAWKPEAG